jgi:dephospho-CoA kinase
VVLSADRIARELTDDNPGVRSAIARKFGPELYAPGGKLRRGELARLVFAEPAKLRALNAIVHPLVFSSLNDALALLPDSRSRPYVVVEAALIFESGMDRNLDATVVVRAPEEIRISRVLERDAMRREDVVARMRAQMNPEESAGRADFVIENAGSEGDLTVKVEFIDTILGLMFTGEKSVN